MTDCAECGHPLEGQPVVEDHPEFSAGDLIPEDGPYYEEEIAYVPCPGCGSERPVRPKDWWDDQRRDRESPEEL